MPGDAPASWARRWLPPVAGFAAAVGAWHLYVVGRDVDPWVLPTPGRVARTAADELPDLWPDVLATGRIAAIGLVLGAAAGVAIALVVVRVRLARQVLLPLLVASQTIPTIVLAPLFVVWWGFGSTPKVVLVVLITFFPVLVSTVAAMDAADADLVDLVRSTGAGPGRVLRAVRLPGALPGAFGGLRIAATYTIGGAVIAEYLGGTDAARGLGFRILAARQSYEVDRIFVVVALVGVLTAVLFVAIDGLARWATPWQQPDRPRRALRASPRQAIDPLDHLDPSDPLDPLERP